MNHISTDNLAPVTTYINWRLIVDVDFGALHFCGTIGANLAKLIFWQFWSFSPYVDSASLGLQKCYAPKFTSAISLQLIYLVTGAILSVEICFI